MKTLLVILRNKYFLVTTGFILWIFFFAEYDVMTQYKQRTELNEMKAKIIYLEAQIDELIKEKNALRTDSGVIEKYAREKYYMKSPNEEVFVFDTLDVKKK